MKLKLIGLCLVSIFCLILKCRKVGASFFSHGKVVNSALNLLGFTSAPANTAEWERAFLLLASEYAIMNTTLHCKLNELNTEYAALNTTLHCKLNKINREYAALNTPLPSKLNLMTLKYDWKNEYDKLVSGQIAQDIVENCEETMLYHCHFPQSADMRKRLQKDKGLLDDAALSDANGFSLHESVHRLKWLYFITYVEASFAEKLRNLLRSRNVSAFDLSGVIGQIHQITCGKVHNLANYIIDAKNAEAGLRMYGVRHKALLDCTRIIWEMPKLTGFIPESNRTDA